MKAGAIRAWSWVHKWSSLVSTIFLLMLCVTGLPLVFSHELDHWLLDEAWAPANPEGEMLDLDEVLGVALARHPGDVPAFMSFDEDRPVVNVTSRAPDAPAGEFNFQPIDQTSGDPAPLVAGHPVMEVLLQLHTDLFLGLPGMLFLGAMGLLLVAAVVSGVVLYAPFMRRLPFGTLRLERAALPGMTLQFVAFPGSDYSTDHHYAVFFHGDTPLTTHMTTPALIDVRTGELAAVAPMPWYVKTLSLSQPLHFGDYGGLALKIAWALLDLATIVILGSGLYLWLARRRRPA